MTRATSLYLECLRVVAFASVFFAHSFHFYDPLTVLLPRQVGRDGVVIFFVLSGYIITWCAETRDRTLRDFLTNRAARIYSVAIPALLVSYALALAPVQFLGGELPDTASGIIINLLISISFSGDFWKLSLTPPVNYPYWSLNYEVWYYLLFAAGFYASPRVRPWLVGGILLLVGYKLWLLLPIWLLGHWIYRNRERLTLPVLPARALFFGSIAAYAAVKVWGLDDMLDARTNLLFAGEAKARLGQAYDFAGNYLVALLAAFNIMGFLGAGFVFEGCAARAFAKAAGVSFSFYLFHIPAFEIWRLFRLTDPASLASYLGLLAGSILVIVLLARITEARKGAWRTVFRDLAPLSDRRMRSTTMTRG